MDMQVAELWRRENGYIRQRMLKLPVRRKRGKPYRRFMDVLNEDMQSVSSVMTEEDAGKQKQMIHRGDKSLVSKKDPNCPFVVFCVVSNLM